MPVLVVPALLAAGALGLLRAEAGAQGPAVTGYYLHALVGVEETPLSPAGILDVQRLRLMSRPRIGPATLQVALEQVLTLRTDDLGVGRGLEGTGPAGPWLPLQGTPVDGRRIRWDWVLDRLSVALPVGERTRITAGRQTVSWATGLYFSPTDPFLPFDPADPLREYRGGVDALRAVVHLGPFSELDAVVRRAPDTGFGETTTALLRGQHLLGAWEVAGWVGILHDEPALALAGTRGLGAFGFRGEIGLRHDEGRTRTRLVVGADRLFELAERDFRAVLEFQRDDLGASRAADLPAVARSPAAARGELQVLGRDALVVHGSWQVRPLTSVALLTLANLRDGSLLLSPGVTHSLADEISLRLGVFAGLGPGMREGGPGSEHGSVPLAGFAAVSWFF